MFIELRSENHQKPNVYNAQTVCLYYEYKTLKPLLILALGDFRNR